MRADGNYLVDVLPGMVTAPLGFGLAMPALMTLGMADSKPEDAGVTSGLFNTAQQVGGAVGLAVISTAVSARTGTLLDGGQSQVEALTGGFRLGYGVAAGLAAAALIIAIAVIKTRKASDTEAEPVPVAVGEKPKRPGPPSTADGGPGRSRVKGRPRPAWQPRPR